MYQQQVETQDILFSSIMDATTAVMANPNELHNQFTDVL
jgi:hypothetical protein